MNRVEKIMKRIQEHYDYLRYVMNYDVVFIALQGSQNYELDVYDEEYMSDVDTKAVILPSFEDFVYNKEPKSRTLVLDNNEHIDVKDIRVMFETYKKQNVNYIETIFTDFKIINPKYKDLVQPLFDNAEEIAHININQALRCMAGMSMEKLKALEHPYPTIVDKINKYGYEAKFLNTYIGAQMSASDDKFTTDVITRISDENRRNVSVIDVSYTPSQNKSVLGKAQFIVTVPLHPLILGASENVPVFSLAYASKNKCFMEQIKHPEHIYKVEQIEDKIDINKIICFCFSD